MNKPLIRHRAIAASAGSGKTFQLAHRFIRLMAAGVEPDRIAALTFSRKAASEIFDSIVNHLCAACASETHAAEAAKRIRISALNREDFLQLLKLFLEKLHRHHIGTLDSFIVGILRAFPAELGISPDFRIMDEDGPAADDMRDDVLETIFDPERIGTAAQRDFFEAFKRATFGREEKGLSDMLARLVRDYRATYQLQPDPGAWGLPEKIWPEGERRIRGVPSAPPSADAFCKRLQQRSWPARLTSSFEELVRFAGNYSETARWDVRFDRSTLFVQLLARLPELDPGPVVLSYNRKDIPLTREDCTLLRNVLENLINTECRTSVRQTSGLHAVLELFERQYDTRFRRTGRLTFQDAQYLLTGKTVLSRLADHDGRLYIDYRLDASLDHWLLDEFQDTSDLQWAVLHNLVDELLQDDTGRRSFFFVGDVKQAIYSWRGGNPSLFSQILDEYGSRIVTSPLSTSYRSVPAVIESVNAVFEDLPDDLIPAPTCRAWERAWNTHVSCDALAGQAGSVALLEPDSANGSNKPEPEDRRSLAAALLSQIDPVRRGLTSALLVRSNEEGHFLVETLRRELPGIPVVHEGKASIRDNAVVECLLALIKVAAHPGDLFAWRHIQMSPLSALLEEDSLDRCSLPIRLLESIHSDGFRAFVLDWGRRLERLVNLDRFGRQRLADLSDAAAEFDLAHDRDCDAFLRYVDAYQAHEAGGHDVVRVMTIHQSKGLGFDVVILPELMGRSILRAGRPDLAMGRESGAAAPDWILKMPRRIIAEADPVLAAEMARADAEACFDALCVLYVAMTRARRALYLVTSFPGKSSRSMNPAAFLKQRLCGHPTAPAPVSRRRLGDMSIQVLYETGDPAWYSKHEPAKSPPLQPRPTLARNFGSRPSRRRRLLRIEPSAQDAVIRDAGGLFDAEAHAVLDFGKAMHTLMEHVAWIEDCDPNAIVEKWKQTSTDEAAVQRDVCRQFIEALADREIRSVLARPREPAELWREKHFEIILKERLVSGAFDRVVIRKTPDGAITSAHIIDYKSDRVATAPEIAKAVERHRSQLALYAAAAARILGISERDVSCSLLFTRAARVVPIPIKSSA